MFSRRGLMLMVVMALTPCTSFAQAGVLSLDGAVQTLDQEFKAAPDWRGGGVLTDAPVKELNDPSFSWAAGYIWDHQPPGTPTIWPVPTSNFPAWTSNNQADADPNGDMIQKIGAESPLAWSGTLNLTANKMPSNLAATVSNQDPHGFISGSIDSFPYAQQYGVFAMSAKLPKGNGIWPAFWLLPADKSWPPEIDIMEVIGSQPSALYTTLHTNTPKPAMLAHTTDTGLDLGAEFHEYAVDWGPQQINWYFDRKLVFTQQTPPDCQKPFYILANLGVGKAGAWGGPPDASTVFPATMQIAYIKAWQRPDYSQ